MSTNTFGLGSILLLLTAAFSGPMGRGEEHSSFLGEAVTLRPRLQHFLRVTLAETPEGLEARLTGPQGSGILMSMVQADALLVIPEGQFDTPAGATAQAIRLDEPAHQAEPAF